MIYVGENLTQAVALAYGTLLGREAALSGVMSGAFTRMKKLRGMERRFLKKMGGNSVRMKRRMHRRRQGMVGMKVLLKPRAYV